MKKITVGERISKLRGAKTQADFAKALKVTQGAVSAWERNDKDRAPSADAYFRLASLADNPEDSLYFLGLAGLDPQAVYAVAGKVKAEIFETPANAEIVRVRAYNKRSEDSFGPTLILPTRMVPNPASTYFLRLTEAEEGNMFNTGDIIVLDTTHAGSPYLKPFLGHVVLVGSFPAVTEEKKGNEIHQVFQETAPLMGRLCFLGGQKCSAVLMGIGSFGLKSQFVVSSYQVPSSTEDDRVEEEGRENLRGDNIMPVLGRVIAYIPAEGPMLNWV
jgi:transcriptional regulator with XRE-family HTH domain